MNAWKVILATLVIFSTGAITGTLVTRKPVSTPDTSVTRPSDSSPHGPRLDRRMRRDFLKRFGSELDLTPDQKARIESILSDSQERTRAIWEEVAPQMRVEFQATQEEIREVLTPEQRARFAELMEKRQKDRERGGSRDHRNPPPPGDRHDHPPSGEKPPGACHPTDAPVRYAAADGADATRSR